MCHHPNGLGFHLPYQIGQDRHVSLNRNSFYSVAIGGQRSSICYTDWFCVLFSFIHFPLVLFTVMCYNVLCDKYATRQMYAYCPSWALNWEYRKKVSDFCLALYIRHTHIHLLFRFFSSGNFRWNPTLFRRYHKFARNWNRSVL